MGLVLEIPSLGPRNARLSSLIWVILYVSVCECVKVHTCVKDRLMSVSLTALFLYHFFLKMGVMPTHISVCHMHAWCPEEGATSLENL